MNTDQPALSSPFLLSSFANTLDQEIRSLQAKHTTDTLDETAFDGLENLLADLRQAIILLEALRGRKHYPRQ